MTSVTPSIRFPLFHQPEISIEFFPDELPDDHYDLIDGLRLELAPLKVWKQCALEYYKQGSSKGFDDILGDIVNELKNPEVAAAYRAKEDYAEGVSEIFIVLAAKEILDLAKMKVSLVTSEDVTAAVKRCIENLKAAEAEKLLNEYVWVLKGFFELLQGNTKRSEELFRMTLERVTKAQAAKKKYLFPALIGLGMTSFAFNKFQQALDFFSRAVTTHPECDASVRTAIAACSFKLQQYDRARIALHRANMMDAADINQLVLHALLDLADAKKDRMNRVQLRQKAYEYLYLANKIDNNHPSTLVMLANHDFHSWRTVQLDPMGRLVQVDTMLVPFEGYTEIFEMGNQIRIAHEESKKDTAHLIVRRREISSEEVLTLYPNTGIEGGPGKYFEIQFAPALDFLPAASSEKCIVKRLEMKNLKAVVDAAAKALSITQLPTVRAECHYLLGKVHHLHRNLTLAFEHYGKALQNSGDLAPAAFGAAQIYFARQDYPNALKLFTDLLQGNPDDKDTLAYVKLLRGILHEEIAPIEKLREIAPGFQFEVDLWLSQAQLRHKREKAQVNDFTEALKCYLYAKECLEAQHPQPSLPTAMLGNIANLYYLIGNFDRALEYTRMTLKAFRSTASNTSQKINGVMTTLGDATHSSQPESSSSTEGNSGATESNEKIVIAMRGLTTVSDFENCFYGWKDEPLLALQQDPLNGNLFRVIADDIKLSEYLRVGEEIVIEDMMWTILSFPSDTEMLCKSSYGSTYRYPPLRRLREMRKQFEQQKQDTPGFVMPSTTEMIEILSVENVVYPLSLKRKEIWHNFHDLTLTYCYNFARILEDMGNVQPAMVLYQTIITAYPAHVDCYVRLSRIYRGLGQIPAAIEYLSRGRAIAPDSVDIQVSLGDAYSSLGQLEEAKKLYEGVSRQHRKDPQVLLTMGNYWYNAHLLKKGEDDTALRTSYKFYHPVLMEHVRNPFAANGLGIVCAAKGELEAAREIFLKIRQANHKHTEDADVNLANIYFAEKRYLEAERVYLSVVKALPTNLMFTHVHTSHLLSLIGIAQYSHRKFEESFKTLLKAWHMTPMDAMILFNFSIISNQIANMCIDRIQKTSDEVEIIMNIVQVSIKILHFLATNKKMVGQCDQKELKLKETTAKERLRVLKEQYSVVYKQEEQQREHRRKIDEEHQLRKQQRLELEQQRVEAENSRRQENIDRILQKEKRLEELRSQWEIMNAATASRRGGNDDDLGGEGEEGGAKGRKRKRNPNNNTLEPSEKPKRKERLKKSKKAKVVAMDSDDDEGGKRGGPSAMMDSDGDDDEDGNSWLDDLDKPVPGSSLLASTNFDGQIDSDDDIFGDKEESENQVESSAMEVAETNEVPSANNHVTTPEANTQNRVEDDDDDDFNFD